MKISEAENRVCPFMTENIELCKGVTVKCMITKCMAWKITKTMDDWMTEEYVVKEYGEHTIRRRPKQLSHNDCEGYCRRLR